MPVTPIPKRNAALALTVLIAGSLPAGLRADYRDDVGFTRLQAELGAALPTGAGVPLMQAEAQETPNNFRPDPANPEFAGKTITAQSAGGISNHATTVGAYFYGLASSMAPGVTAIDVFDAGNWIDDALLTGTSDPPLVSTSAVQNHSWIGSGGNEVLRRFDFVIERDDLLAVVGLNNGSATTIPPLLASSYNGISVGLTNGEHSTGTSTADGGGRVKPEIVSPFSVTSFATPSVGAAAALLIEKAQGTAALNDAARSVALKALILAGATKHQFPGWNRTTTRPLDSHFGAGQLNVFRSYHALAQGRQAASGSVTLQPRGWDFAQTAVSAQQYFFEIPAGNSAPAFSAILTWNRKVTAAWPGSVSSLANLALKVYAASGFTPGALIDSSDSSVDNIEHLYLPALPPGRYVMEVTASEPGVNYGLAWYSHSTVTVAATTPEASEYGAVAGAFTVTRAGNTSDPLQVNYVLSGGAASGVDFSALPGSVIIPAGSSSAVIPVTPVADSDAEGDETVTLTLASDFAYSAGAAPAAVVTVHDRPIDHWRHAHFTAAELADPAIGGDLGDADGDALVNRVEYALGLDPKLANVTATPVGTISGGFLSLTYSRPLSAVDVSYVGEVANTLPVWQSGPGHTTSVQIAVDATTETVQVMSATSASTLPQQFIRLRIERKAATASFHAP